MFTILIAEDDPVLLKMMSAFLRSSGFQVTGVRDGQAALDAMESLQPDLVIADVMMPRMDGYELAREIRSAWPRLPLLMVTARDTLADKREGFTAGADDYMTKPVDLDEMLLHVQALLRRAGAATSHRLTVGETVLDYDRLTVTCGTQTLELPKKEFYVLFKLLSNPGQIFTRRQLMDEIWGMDAESDERTVDVHIMRIREKCDRLTDDFAIVTVRGLGYKADRKS